MDVKNFLLQLAAVVGIGSGIWMIYYKRVVAPKLKDINPYLKGQLVIFVPSGIIMIICGVILFIKLL